MFMICLGMFKGNTVWLRTSQSTPIDNKTILACLASTSKENSFFSIEINNTVLLSTTPCCTLDSPKLIHLITGRLY